MSKVSDFYLATSNAVKRQQYNEFGLPYEGRATEDIVEPMTDIFKVAAYKAQQAGPGAVIEDTALEVDDADIGVCVRYLEHTLDEYAGAKAKFQVALGVNDGETVKVYYAETPGTIVSNHFSDAYGFDGNFIPEGETQTIHELLKAGEGRRISTRRLAVETLLRGDVAYETTAEKTPWAGETQEEYLERVRPDIMGTDTSCKLG